MLPEAIADVQNPSVASFGSQKIRRVLTSERVRMKNFAILAASAAVLLSGCGKNSTGSFQGYVEGEYVYVASPLGGALTNLAVARGDSAKAGQLLFELERQSEAAALAQAEKNLAQAQAQFDDLTKGRRPTEIASLKAQLAQAEANLKLSAEQLARREKLDATDVGSKEELDQARAQNDASQAQVNQFTADLATAKLGAREDAIRAAQAAVESQRAARDKAKWSFDQKQQFPRQTRRFTTRFTGRVNLWRRETRWWCCCRRKI